MVLQGGSYVWQRGPEGMEGHVVDLSWLWEHFTVYAVDTGESKDTKRAVQQVREHPERDQVVEQIGDITRKMVSMLQTKGD